MSGVTSTGFVGKTFTEIETELTTRANTPEYYGEVFPTTPDSIFGILSGIIAASLKDQYDLSKAVASQGNVDEASGKFLDDLAALNGTTRLDSAPSTGSLVFTATDGTTIPQLTPVKFNQSGRTTLASETVLVSRVQCYRMKITVPDAINGKLYLFRINGFQYVATGMIGSTITSIRDALVAYVNSSGDGLIATPSGIGGLIVEFEEYRNGMTLNTISNLTLTSVATIVKYQAALDGEINFFANSIVSLVGVLSGVISVENVINWSIGREVETDEELRVRLSAKPNIIGTATKPAIESRISNLDGVLSTLLLENTTMSVDSNGLPPKSYELFVEGGEDDVIASEIWETKPAGITTYGSISKVIIDRNGDDQVVNFSRFDNKYGWVKVLYTLNSEEIFPLDGETLIRNTVVDTGNSFKRGEDLESTKFIGDLYRNVQGIYVYSIETAITDNPTDTPSYSTARKPISNTVKLLFDVARSSTQLL